VRRVLLAAVLPGQVKERDEHPVVLHGFVGDLQARDLIGFDVDHGMNFQPSPLDLPRLPHPPTPG